MRRHWSCASELLGYNEHLKGEQSQTQPSDITAYGATSIENREWLIAKKVLILAAQMNHWLVRQPT
jgi:hypothetical protein